MHPGGAPWALAIALGALALTAVLYWPTSLEIAARWEDTVQRRYTHGWLILAVTVWLVWRERHEFRGVPFSPPRGGWLLVGLGSLGWLVGHNAGVMAVTTLALPVLALGAVWAAAGMPLVRRLRFPYLYLYFALPVWELINPALQWLTAVVTIGLTRVAAIPATMDEYLIHIPAGTFEIAGGCSGLHFFIVAIALATLQGQRDEDDARTRALLIALAAGLALVTNWLRVFIIIVAGHLTDMQHFLVKVDHYYFGWVLFVFALALYFVIAARIPRRGDATRRAPVEAGPPRAKRASAAAAAVALAAGPAWALAESPAPLPGAAAAVPVVDGWGAGGLYVGDWRPVFAGADAETFVAYQRHGSQVAAYRALYLSQRQGRELRGFGNSVAGADVVVAESRRITPAGVPWTLDETVAVGALGRQRVIWSTFAVDGRPDPMGLTSRLAYGARSLLSAPVASVIAFSAECRPDCGDARARLAEFVPSALPALLDAAAGSGEHASR